MKKINGIDLAKMQPNIAKVINFRDIEGKNRNVVGLNRDAETNAANLRIAVQIIENTAYSAARNAEVSIVAKLIKLAAAIEECADSLNVDQGRRDVEDTPA